MKKIKVFLAGYVNAINAQNFNCRSLAMHLDRNKFEIGVMIYPGGQLSMGKEFDGVKKFKLLTKLYRPLRFVRHINYIRGLLWCDIAYLPKGEIFRFVQKVARLLGKKTFMTIEGVMNHDNHQVMLKCCGSDDGIRLLYNGCDKNYSITQFMADENNRLLGIKSDGVLYLGVEGCTFECSKKFDKTQLTDIIFVGSNLKHKRIHEFIELSKLFPGVSFHIAGGDPAFEAEFNQMDLPNMTYHGRLNHDDLAELLMKMDVHVFTSRSEGFPKVTLETAAAGVPSIVYGDYGAAEWITTGVDGYVVDTFDEIVEILKDLQAHPEKINELSKNASEMAKRFYWENLIKDWEKAIVDVYNGAK